MMVAYDSPGEKRRRPRAEECFAVRNLASTLEVEQGLADLRERLRVVHVVGDDAGMEELRTVVRWAVEGVGLGFGGGEGSGMVMSDD